MTDICKIAFRIMGSVGPAVRLEKSVVERIFSDIEAMVIEIGKTGEAKSKIGKIEKELNWFYLKLNEEAEENANDALAVALCHGQTMKHGEGRKK